MYSNHDLSDIDTIDELDSPLDHLDSLDADSPPAPDPEVMLGLLTHSEASQRMIAARAFCELEEPRAIADLIALLGDACPLVRVSAAYALGRNTSPEAVQPLINILQTDWNGYVRKGVVGL
jgi:HEAT repeat protein